MSNHLLESLQTYKGAIGALKDVIGVVILVPAAIWTVLIYRKSKRKESAEWLHSLFSSFYLTPEFRNLRMHLEFDYSEKLCPLIERDLIDENAIFSEPEKQLLCDLDTSLNYFEFILHLESEGQLRNEDRQAIFNYWYELLAEPTQPSLRIYLRRFGYEKISDLLQARCECVAFYGSLMKDQGPQEKLLITGKLKLVGSCSIPGTLYDLGEYPGLVKGDGVVPGELYEVADKSVFIKLDDYEEFNHTHPDQSLFVRRGVRLSEPKVDCWVYFFCGDVSSAKRIEGMSWADYKKVKRGHP